MIKGNTFDHDNLVYIIEQNMFLTKNDAKCSDVRTALKPTTGTNAASNVPKTTCAWDNNKSYNEYKSELKSVQEKILASSTILIFRKKKATCT